MAYPSNDVPGRRAARLTLVSVVLWLAALALLVFAALLGYTGEATGTTAHLPLPVDYSRPALSITFAALAASGAVLVGLAAAQTAVAMRVLDRDRRLPPTISS